MAIIISYRRILIVKFLVARFKDGDMFTIKDILAHVKNEGMPFQAKSDRLSAWNTIRSTVITKVLADDYKCKIVNTGLHKEQEGKWHKLALLRMESTIEPSEGEAPSSTEIESDAGPESNFVSEDEITAEAEEADETGVESFL